MKPRTFASLACVFAAIPVSICSAAVIDLLPGSPHLVPIEQVKYEIGGLEVIQNSPAPNNPNNQNAPTVGDAPVRVTSVRITDGAPVELTYFNTEAAWVVNVNPEFATTDGVGVFQNGTFTYSKDDLTAYADAFAATVLDTDLRNYTFHDYLVPGPTTPGVPDLDVMFFRAFLEEDYVLVSERWGNAQFSITALKADGTPYDGANTLRLGGPGGTPFVGYEVYDWNTGVAASSYLPYQAQMLSVFSVREFFANTNATPGPVFGFRIDNDGEADPKIMGISANSFSNNPVIPEPSGFLLALGGGLLWLARRRRN
jgi:hypothetical protein